MIGLEGPAFLITALLQLRIEEAQLAADILRHRRKADLCFPQFAMVLEASARDTAHVLHLFLWRRWRIRRVCDD
jgi:hypothetical protein